MPWWPGIQTRCICKFKFVAFRMFLYIATINGEELPDVEKCKRDVRVLSESVKIVALAILFSIIMSMVCKMARASAVKIEAYDRIRYFKDREREGL